MAANNQMALIEKLTGRENYTTWRFAVKTYLQHEELWDCIEPDTNIPVDAKRDTKTRTKLILLVDPTNYVHIQEASTAREVWNKLSTTFDDSGLTRRVGLLRNLCNTSLTGCQNIEDYVSKIMNTAHKLRNIGFKVDDEWLGTLLLSGLPDSYQPMIIAIESSGMKITSDSVKSKLLQEVRQSDNTSTAFMANKKAQYNKRKQSKGPRCYTCNKYGHKSPECKSKTKDGQQKTGSSSYTAVFIATSTQDGTWYVDSGASSHMTRHKNLIQNVTTPVVQNIRTADNKVLHVQCSGEVSLDIFNEKGEENKVLFTNVLYVPELATNLISVSQIIRSGGQVRFNERGCVIMNSKGQIVATASLIKNMYRLNMSEKSFTCMSDVGEHDSYLWHQRMGHLIFHSLSKMTENTDHVILPNKMENLTCVTCKEGKQTRLPFKSDSSRANKILDLVHSDICGPMETETLGGARYFITFLDDHSKKIYVYFLRNKSDALKKVQEFRHEVENQKDTRIKVLRTDNGLEYVNKSFSDYLKDAGIIHQTTTPYTPEQNGTAERMNRTLIERAKCMLLNANLPKQYWGEAIHTAAYVINRSPTKSLSFKTTEEIWTGQKPSVNHMRIFGCEAMVHLPKEKRKKWDPKAHKMIFIGYCTHTKGYRFIIPGTKRIVKSRDATFLESTVKRDYVPVQLSTNPATNKDNIIQEEAEERDINDDLTSDDSYESVQERNRSSSDSEYVPDTSIGSPQVSNITLRPRNNVNKLVINSDTIGENIYLCQLKRLSQMFQLHTKKL